MDDEKKIVVEFEDDALADAAHAAHDLAVDDVNRWIDGAEDEGAEEIEAFEALADDVAGQRFDVDNDVGKFRQRLTTNDQRPKTNDQGPTTNDQRPTTIV